MAKRHEKITEKNIEMANGHMKECSASLAIREMQSKTPMRYYYVLITATVKNSDNTKRWQGCGSTRSLICTGRNLKWYCHSGKNLTIS